MALRGCGDGRRSEFICANCIFSDPCCAHSNCLADGRAGIQSSVRYKYRTHVSSQFFCRLVSTKSGGVCETNPIVTIASGSYAIVKAYKYAESRLQYRLQDFLDREESRLKGAREQLRLAIERPGTQRPFRSPIFLAPALRRTVREFGWGSYFLPPQLPYADFQVSASVDQVQKQIKLSGDRHTHLNKQLAAAHLLKGAMLAAEATKLEQSGKESRAPLTAALNQFTAALAVYPKDVEALEYASHMHVRLGVRRLRKRPPAPLTRP